MLLIKLIYRDILLCYTYIVYIPTSHPLCSVQQSEETGRSLWFKAGLRHIHEDQGQVRVRRHRSLQSAWFAMDELAQGRTTRTVVRDIQL